MRLILEKRADTPLWLAIASPLIAVALTIVSGVILFIALGIDPVMALRVYFIDPVSDSWAFRRWRSKRRPSC